MHDTLDSLLRRIDNQLKIRIDACKHLSPALHDAMSYSLFSGGKRFRALLIYAIGLNFGATLDALDAPACAVEAIHTYSLIHDDLPAMDDDDYRRGKPTCHKAFDEATAILAGDALLTHAFEWLSDENTVLSNKQRLALIRMLSHAAGSEGMIAGQSIDITQSLNTFSLETLNQMHLLKTGKLIQAAMLSGLMASPEHTTEKYRAMETLGEALGLVYQLQDDLFDSQDAKEDESKNHVSLFGLKETNNAVKKLLETMTTISDQLIHLPLAKELIGKISTRVN